MHIDASHPKFEWLSGQEAGRIVKINEKGRWNSSKDYDGLYESIKPRKSKASKAETKKDSLLNETPVASNYGFFYNEKQGYYLQMPPPPEALAEAQIAAMVQAEEQLTEAQQQERKQ